MYSSKELGEGQASISSKGVSHATAGRHDACRRKEQADQWEHEQTDRSGLVTRCIIEDL